jgi:hypothetical protein
MRDFGSGPQEPSLDAVRRADSFVDALAGGGRAIPQDPADAELAALLGGWRDEMRWPPATGLIAEADAVAALNAGLAEKRRPGLDRGQRAALQARSTQNRNRRGLSTIGAAAAAVLCIGGFGAVVAGAGPGDPLYGVRTMLFGASKQVRDDQVGLAAKTELNQVQDLIAQGDWEQAQDKLVAVSTQVATIDNQQQKQELLDQFNDLSAKVVERDPEATAPPGVVYTVPPSSAALVPAVEPTSTPGAPPLTTSATSETPTSGTAPSSDSSTTVTSSPVSTIPTSASPTESSASSIPSTTSPDTQSAQATTPTSVAPTPSAAAPTSATTAANASAEQTTAAPVTTTGEAPRAANTSTAAPAPQTAVSETVPESASDVPAPTAQTPTVQTPTAQTAPAQTEEPLPTAAVTTTPVPVPVG